MKKILVIEDDVDSANMLSMLLRFQGHAVCAVGSGQAGLEHASTSPPDVVIVDLFLPDIHGLDVIRRLTALETKNAAIVALTGQLDSQLRRQARDAGADYFFTKSEEVSKLLSLTGSPTTG